MNTQQEIVNFLLELREEIIARFESLEPVKRFARSPWNYSKGSGGGEMAVLRGDVFEKAAVNFSEIQGPQFPMGDGHGAFFATGISLITHMHNPHAPTVHMNLRFLSTEESSWFGGGYDLTPMGFPYEEDALHFHGIAKETLDHFAPTLYPLFAAQAQEYFFIPHRDKERGVGGIFFDHYNSGNETLDFKLVQEIGNTFLDAIMPILGRRINTPYSAEEKMKQLEMRGHYVEFNLIYDRGTKFGFSSGGNPEAILCSLPPLAKW